MTAIGVVLATIILTFAALSLFTSFMARRFEARFPPTGDLVEIGGGAIHVVEAPPQGAERAVVLLLHGASGNHADMMRALARPLAALGFRVVAVDRPGHGWSSRILGRAASSPSRQASLIEAAITPRGIDRAIVVGHSLGCVSALALSIAEPSLVRALVLLAPVSHPWPGGVNWHYTLGARPWIGWIFRQVFVMPLGLLLLPAGVREVFAPQAPPPGYAELTGLKLVFRPSHFRANAEDVADLKPFVTEQAQRYGSIAAPTEIVTGDSDNVVYAHIHSAGCARDIPRAVFTKLPGVGHSPHHCATESVVSAILRAERRAVDREEAEEEQCVEKSRVAL